MAKFKYENKADLALGYNVAASIPLDSRCVIDTYANLTNKDTWTKPFNDAGQANKAYTGMIVAVVGDNTAANNGVYEFIGQPNSEEGDPSKWVKLSTASSIDAFEDISYDADNENLVIKYKDKTGASHTLTAPMADLITEYQYEGSTDGIVEKDENGSDTATTFNTKFQVTRNVQGQSVIKADVDTIDCGWYY